MKDADFDALSRGEGFYAGAVVVGVAEDGTGPFSELSLRHICHRCEGGDENDSVGLQSFGGDEGSRCSKRVTEAAKVCDPADLPRGFEPGVCGVEALGDGFWIRASLASSVSRVVEEEKAGAGMCSLPGEGVIEIVECEAAVSRGDDPQGSGVFLPLVEGGEEMGQLGPLTGLKVDRAGSLDVGEGEAALGIGAWEIDEFRLAADECEQRQGEKDGDSEAGCPGFGKNRVDGGRGDEGGGVWLPGNLAWCGGKVQCGCLKGRLAVGQAGMLGGTVPGLSLRFGCVRDFWLI